VFVLEIVIKQNVQTQSTYEPDSKIRILYTGTPSYEKKHKSIGNKVSDLPRDQPLFYQIQMKLRVNVHN